MQSQSQPAPPAWLWYLFPAVTMSLGWGLRGTIGGGPLGAMIPGAMIGLALCLLLGREKNAGFVAGFAAIGAVSAARKPTARRFTSASNPGISTDFVIPLGSFAPFAG